MNDPNKKDFLDFVHSKSGHPSSELNSKVLGFVKNELDPSHKIVFTKLISIQAFIGFLTLSFCPQFNLSLTNRFELLHYFHHQFGAGICMIICGTIFIGSGALFAAYLLKSSEVNKIKQSRFLYYLSVSILALSIFFILGSEVYLTMALYWLIGSTLGGLAIFEMNRVIREKVLHF